LLKAFIGLMAAGAVAVSASAAHHASPPTSASNRAAAASDAKALLSRLTLPAGSSQLPARPGWSGGCPCQLTPNLVDVHSWWEITEPIDQVVAFVESHQPPGSTLVGTGSGSGPGYSGQSVTFQWRPRPGVLSTRWLVISATSLPDGSTGVRADGESVWITPRPASERIPPAKRVRITVTRFERLEQGPIVVRTPQRVRRLRALINGLPEYQPGTRACPLDHGVRVALAFFDGRAAAHPVAQATVAAGGCGGVALQVRGRHEPTLAGPGNLVARINAIIGRHLKTR
jgi:hypothetical protein